MRRQPVRTGSVRPDLIATGREQSGRRRLGLDRRLQEVIRRVFQMFRVLGSAHQVLLWMRIRMLRAQLDWRGYVKRPLGKTLMSRQPSRACAPLLGLAVHERV